MYRGMGRVGDRCGRQCRWNPSLAQAWIVSIAGGACEIATNRLLIASVSSASGIDIDIAVIYAPHSQYGKQVLEQWWAEATQSIASGRRPAVPPFCLGDFNARLGDIIADACGGHLLDKAGENHMGRIMHRFMLSLGLWAPSTFEAHGADCAEDQWSWQAPGGQEKSQARLDYVCAPWPGYHGDFVPDAIALQFRHVNAHHLPQTARLRHHLGGHQFKEKVRSTWAGATML